MAKQRRDRELRIESMTPEQRELFADNLRERVYSTITLIAVLTVMWQSDAHHTALGAIGVILGSVFALWLATLISSRMAYRAIHGQPISRRSYIRALFAASGLIVPAIVPVIIVGISGATSLYSLKAAVTASIVVSLLSLFLLSLNAGRKIYSSFLQTLLISVLEMSVGFVVIVLKLAVGE